MAKAMILKRIDNLECQELPNIESPIYVRWEINTVTFNINDLNRSKIRNFHQFVWDNYCRNTGRKFGESELKRLIHDIEVGRVVLVKRSTPPMAPMFEYTGPDDQPTRDELYWGHHNHWRYIGGDIINSIFAQQIISTALMNNHRNVLVARRYDLVPLEVLKARGEYEYEQERERREREKKPTFRSDFDTHVTKVDKKPKTGRHSIDKNGSIKGGHNATEFEKALKDPVGGGVEAQVLNRTDIIDSTGKVIGQRIQYRVPRLEGNGPNAGKAAKDKDGNILYKPAQTKTVYDPQVISDEEMLDQLKAVGIEAFSSKVDEYIKSGDDNCNFSYSKDGLDYFIYLKKDESGKPYIDNIHLE
jgi:hypothetical protein